MIEYSQIGEEDIETIIAKTQRFLTDGEKIAKDIRESFADGNYFGMKATDDGKLVAFFSLKEGGEFTYPHPELEEKVRAVTLDGKLFTGDGYIVDPDHRGTDIGKKVMRLAFDMISSRGGRYFLGELWIHPDGVMPGIHVGEGCGKIIYEEQVPLFYKELAKYGMVCPICGKDCRCGAKIRLLDVRRHQS